MTDCTSRLWLADGTRDECTGLGHAHGQSEFGFRHVGVRAAWNDDTPGAHESESRDEYPPGSPEWLGAALRKQMEDAWNRERAVREWVEGVSRGLSRAT